MINEFKDKQDMPQYEISPQGLQYNNLSSLHASLLYLNSVQFGKLKNMHTREYL